MAVKRPDIYEHNNPNNAIVDSDFVRGGRRTPVADLTALYALSSKADQLKENSTIIYVAEEDADYILVDITKVGEADGWKIFSSGSKGIIKIQIPTTATNNIKEFIYKPFPLNETGTLQKGDIAKENWVSDTKYGKTLIYKGTNGIALDATTNINDWNINEYIGN